MADNNNLDDGIMSPFTWTLTHIWLNYITKFHGSWTPTRLNKVTDGWKDWW